ncbi:L-threonylcarbamoyladenylate synthase, partial [uncultured Desulfovibrio sp.]|uniref:L-threonylcarbamoyladenylate synthase n=1 Tax=uncultured Desulfovibrio sp. TaxID=167968 RepID=UPI00263AF548
MPSLPHARAPRGELRSLSLEEAARRLAAGGIVIFPTETLYAIGCRADKPDACARLCALKGRPAGSPLPLLAADAAQAARAVRLEAAPLPLLRRFWPGPLSLLLPALPELARDMLRAKRAGATTLLMYGAHVIRTGCGEHMIELMRRGL